MLSVRIDRRILAHFDLPLFFMTLLIPAVGLLVLYSAGYNSETAVQLFGFLPKTVPSIAFARQLVFVSAGLGALFIFAIVDARIFYKYAYLFYGICLVLLVGVLVGGTVSNGARRWLSLGGIQCQPSEFIKIAMIFALARYLSVHLPGREGLGFKELLVPFLIFVVPMGLIMKQPDLGTAMCLGLVGFSILLFVGIRLKTLLFMGLSLVIAVFPAWHYLHDYQRNRIFALFDPTRDPLGSGYHIIQSKIAVGSGQFLGKGFLKGTQSQLMFLPEHTTDFVFSVLAEEWGFVGSSFVLCLYICLLLLILRIVKRSKDTFSSLVCFGIGALFFTHVIVNIGMVIGVLPVVGITLPLFSYGGSSVITFMTGVGIVLGIGMRRWVFSSV